MSDLISFARFVTLSKISQLDTHLNELKSFNQIIEDFAEANP